MSNEVLLTAREAAEELGVHVGTVHNAFQESRLPFVALYGRKLISRADLNVTSDFVVEHHGCYAFGVISQPIHSSQYGFS